MPRMLHREPALQAMKIFDLRLVPGGRLRVETGEGRLDVVEGGRLGAELGLAGVLRRLAGLAAGHAFQHRCVGATLQAAEGELQLGGFAVEWPAACLSSSMRLIGAR